MTFDHDQDVSRYDQRINISKYYTHDIHNYAY